jgi:DNA-3-methyladenine glycosylase II
MMHIHRMNELHAAFIAHLSQEDPILLREVERHGELPWQLVQPHFDALCRAIIGQQLSTKAAATIARRFEAWAEGCGGLKPDVVLDATVSELRALGLSGQKVTYITALAEAWNTHAELHRLEQLKDEEVIKALTAIKGIGEWTAQMFLLFTLRRPDVFAPRDLGIKKAMERLYGLSMASSEGELVAFSERWSPYRSLACRHLWQVLDAVD